MVFTQILGYLLNHQHQSTMTKGSIVLATGLLLLLGSCATFRYLPVDLTSPAKEPLPNDIQSLTLVNRAVDRRFTNDPADTIQLRFYQAQFNLDTMMYDVASSDTLLQTLAILLFESGRFDVVIPEERFLMKDSLNLYSVPMSWDDAEKLTKAFNTDAVLSLDFYKTQVRAEYGRKQDYSPGEDRYFTLYAAGMEIGYIANFRVYDPRKKEQVTNLFISDTLYWSDADYDLNTMFRRFTPVKRGLIEAGIDAALEVSGKIAPVWNQQRRAYFDKGNKVLRQTNEMVQNHDWEHAREIWAESAAKSRSRVEKSKYEFNIALACEMVGDLDEAIRWSLKSYETMYRPVTYRYLEILKSRKSILKTDYENQ